MRSFRSPVLALVVSTLAACVPPALSEGQYLCAVAETDCPRGWSCLAGRCYSSRPTGDASSLGDASSVGDAGIGTSDAWEGLDANANDDAAVANDDAAVANDDAAMAPNQDAAVESPDAGPVASGVTLAVGSRHACAVGGAGTVYCWGDNAAGGLGLPVTTPSSPTPVAVPGVPAARELCAGTGFACARTADAHVTCWGNDELWQLGRASTSPASAAEVPGVVGATAIACGATHACAATASGVTCWGGNASAQTGNAPSARELPHVVSGVHAVSLTAGTSHTCALAADGGVACWGGSAMGQLGELGPTPSSLARSATPVSQGALRAIAIGAGAEHTCAVRLDGSVACWGRADTGRLGLLATGPHPASVTVSSAGSMHLVASGDEMSCAAGESDGALQCWGSAAFGQLGSGGALHTGSNPVPIPVSSMPSGVSRVDAGGGFGCAVAAARVFCWGMNDRGQLGDGSTMTRTAPVEVLLP